MDHSSSKRLGPLRARSSFSGSHGSSYEGTRERAFHVSCQGCHRSDLAAVLSAALSPFLELSSYFTPSSSVIVVHREHRQYAARQHAPLRRPREYLRGAYQSLIVLAPALTAQQVSSLMERQADNCVNKADPKCKIADYICTYK